MAKNVFGEKLKTCSNDPITGFYRDGCCNTGEEDKGRHTVCVILTKKFLRYSKKQGNDLITPRPMYNFPGLKPGDKWCLCAGRWKEAWAAGKAPPVLLEATHEATLKYVPLEELVKHAYRENSKKES